jgi:YD repeat-containing protein
VDTPGENNKKVTTYEYYDDSTGNLHREIVTGYSNGTPFTYTTTYQYDTHGHVTQIDNPRTDVNDVTTYTYDPTYGYLLSIEYPNGRVTYGSYDANHNVGSIRDLNGVTTTYTYDYADRVKTITVGSAVTTYAYDALGNIDYVTLPEGNRIDYEYDTSNRVIKITDALGNYIYYEYDGEGNKTREEIRDDQGVIKKYLDFEYDQFNRINKIKNPDNSSTGFSYDNNGNRIQMIKPEGEINEYEYDELSRLKRVTESKGTSEEAITEYEYDVQDNLTQVKDAEGKVTRYSYDDMGRLISTVSPDAGTTSYLYDEAGNIKTRTDAKGMVTSFEYDALNRLVKFDFSTDQDITYTYDETDIPYGIGRLTTMADASGTTRYSYDGRGNVTEQSCTIDGRTFITGYEYNLNNVAKKISYPGGIVVEYGLDSIGKITGLTMNGSTIASEVIYEPFGELNTMNFALNNIDTTITRNNQYQISEIQAGNVLHRTYTHDFNGNITYIQRNDSLPLPQIYPAQIVTIMRQGKTG